MQYLRSHYLSLPEDPGVYQFLDQSGSVLYVGKAKNLKSRVSSYFTGAGQLGEKTRVLVSQIHKIKITIVESELESLLLEAYYIKKFTPKYNIRMTDGKAYPLIEITLADQYPAVLLARRPTNPKSVYFGPYPSAGTVKFVLKTIRRIFPYLSTRNHAKRVCLYHHLGLCPCPPVFDSPELKKNYRHTTRRIIKILEGESRNLIKELSKERDRLSKDEHFEEAGSLQKQINALTYITQPFHRPFEYEINPNLREDVRQGELNSLMHILNDAGYSLSSLHRIECYDISHFQGSLTTASLVVLIDGEIDKSQYRKFKIRLEKTPDDFASMEEVLTRRLKHTDWEYPDLIVVDGGKGQVSAALKAFSASDVQIPLIGLAKREETIVVPLSHPLITRHSGAKHGDAIESPHNGRRSYQPLPGFQDDKLDEGNFQEISLPKDSKALHVIMRIRDEAHRFAVTYHRKLRSKAFTG